MIYKNFQNFIIEKKKHNLILSLNLSPINAITALKIGLIDEINPKNKELDFAIKIADSIAKRSTNHMLLHKKQ